MDRKSVGSRRNTLTESYAVLRKEDHPIGEINARANSIALPIRLTIFHVIRIIQCGVRGLAEFASVITVVTPGWEVTFGPAWDDAIEQCILGAESYSHIASESIVS